MTWRTMSFVLGVTCAVLLWRDCTRGEPSAPAVVADCAKPADPRAHDHHFADVPSESDEEPPPPAAKGAGPALFGFQVPAWAMWLAPHPGENLRAYRDRMLPLAMTVIGPHRTRVARSRDDLAATIGLDAKQLGNLDAAAQAAASALEERVLGAFMNDELSPATFKPMTGVAIARDLLEIVDKQNHVFVDALSEDQRAKLAQHPFDFGDYLVFSTKWEALLGD